MLLLQYYKCFNSLLQDLQKDLEPHRDISRIMDLDRMYRQNKRSGFRKYAAMRAILRVPAHERVRMFEALWCYFSIHWAGVRNLCFKTFSSQTLTDKYGFYLLTLRGKTSWPISKDEKCGLNYPIGKTKKSIPLQKCHKENNSWIVEFICQDRELWDASPCSLVSTTSSFPDIPKFYKENLHEKTMSTLRFEEGNSMNQNFKVYLIRGFHEH